MLTLHWIAFAPPRKSIPDRLSVHTQKWLWRRDFCDGANCCAARRSLKWRVTYRIGVHSVPDSFVSSRNKVTRYGVNTALN